MDFNQVKELLALVNQSDLTEFDLQMDNVSMRMSKNTHSLQSAQQPNNDTRSNEAPSSVKTTSTKPEMILKKDETIKANESEIEQVKEGNMILSPLVGVTYMSSGPDQPIFKKVGDPVIVGDVLCIVEAMKLMNEIKSEVEGTIAEIYVEDEQVVEYNQPLFRII
ncbi:acetyl-CoA carboxylase biotin carboxyl carrier protein [Carnobacterium iners]|uniref:Biotin carboxyl carrier protein of acetyl-CoA carboxylase n=1 Tax=Carnobacterium iners TaxID=1073423 RepID=A0A1X7NJQ2_9LACT|nr:acetyl-CoA carboxylase biotin carboxyl carrier protein [Carnobacterium iners]SEK64852.1 acetyl-CoA carboxylase biotin carboxyl carrier protein [Carnobacterium iners]SMH37399.1 acetyl-CoA carboxylase biotin carboxyl carrier protein [Carnobacterium iners]